MKGVMMLLVEKSTGYERASDCAEITARSGGGGSSWRSRQQNQDEIFDDGTPIAFGSPSSA